MVPAVQLMLRTLKYQRGDIIDREHLSQVFNCQITDQTNSIDFKAEVKKLYGEEPSAKLSEIMNKIDYISRLYSKP